MGQPSRPALIARLFPDQTIQRALLELAQTPTGAKFLDYLLYMGGTFGPGYITWNEHAGPGDPGGWSTTGGMIRLNASTSSTDAANAALIVHEATESYFDTQGIRQMGTQHADYVAEWFAGQFLEEEHDRQAYIGDFGYGAYGLTFAQWIRTDDGANFLHEFPVVYLDDWSRSLAGYAWQDGGPLVDVRDAPDTMGLAPQMLTADVVDQAVQQNATSAQ